MHRVSRVLVLKQILQKMINLAVSPHSPRNATLAATKQESSDLSRGYQRSICKDSHVSQMMGPL